MIPQPLPGGAGKMKQTDEASKSLAVLYTGYVEKKNPLYGGGYRKRFVVLTGLSIHWFIRVNDGHELFGEERYADVGWKQRTLRFPLL